MGEHKHSHITGINVKWYISWDGGLAYLTNYNICVYLLFWKSLFMIFLIFSGKTVKIYMNDVYCYLNFFFLPKIFYLSNVDPVPNLTPTWPQLMIAQGSFLPLILWQVSQRRRQKVLWLTEKPYVLCRETMQKEYHLRTSWKEYI